MGEHNLFGARDLSRIRCILIQGGSNMTGTDFFFEYHNCQTFTCTCQSSTYSPPESTHFFQRSGSILMPFSKKACGWWRIYSRTVWMTADDHAVHSPRALCPLWCTYTTETHGSVRDTLPHTVVGVCGEFQRTGLFSEEFDHNVLFHSPWYLLFAHHSSNSQTALNRF
jgi:hypothetical protein